MLQSEFSDNIKNLQEQEEKILIQKELALKKALQSEDVDQILKARQFIRNSDKNVKGLEKKEDIPIKSILVDPYDLSSSFGYKNKSHSISYDVLRVMARTHIIKAIIETRKTQVSNFCQPQANKYSAGFVIQPKSKFTSTSQKSSITRSQEQKIEYLIEFLLGGGSVDNFWHGDSFDVFISKIVNDSLIFDQGCFEIGRDNTGVPSEFMAVDAATMRISDSYDDDQTATQEVKIKGYTPSYVQVIDSQVVNEYYPWQLCFGLRNPSTDIRSHGYGRSELEDMIQTVTALLNSDFYNANFFKVGSAPKGILKYSGDINMNTIEQFKNQWVAQTAGVMNMHKIPLINADKLDFVNLQQSNKDMEFAKFQEFLIKISCAMYKIDPSEIGFPMSGNSTGTNGLGGDSTAEKLKYSKDKGLKPLLKQIERWINKYIISQIDKNFEFRFVGIDDETTFKEELEANVTMLQNFKTLNEIRREYNLDPIKGGDIVLNSITFQQYMMEQQNKMAQGGGGDEEGQGDNPFDTMFGNEQDQEEQNPFKKEQQDNEGETQNPFQKSLMEDVARMLSQEIPKN
jgi:hypothetical protein